MARYRNPICQAPDMDGRGTCDVTMTPLGERHPSFGPNYHPGGWVFLCPKCSAVRFIEDEKVNRYLERVRA
jgi:hypothetical protein